MALIPMSLTRKQYNIFRYIDTYIRTHGIAPTYQEICTEMEIKSLSGAHRFILELKERGYIEHNPKKSRAISIIRDPLESDSAKEPHRSQLHSKPTSTSFHRDFEDSFELGPSQVVTIPLYGTIAAGPSIEAIRDQSSFIDLPSAMIDQGQHYALKVSGESMSGAAILDGDIAIIKQQSHAQNGDIVVALTQDNHVTLKYFYFDQHKIQLKPANPDYEIISLFPNQIRIQGKLIHILRSY